MFHGGRATEVYLVSIQEYSIFLIKLSANLFSAYRFRGHTLGFIAIAIHWMMSPRSIEIFVFIFNKNVALLRSCDSL